MVVEHVDGENKGKIMLYALSTCVWCRKTKSLLDKLGLEYSYIYMDLIGGKEKEDALKDLEKWNCTVSQMPYRSAYGSLQKYHM